MKIRKILNIKQIISVFCLGLLILFNIRIYAQEEDEEEIQHRAEWFIHYRTFPNTTFPENGYSNAFQQKHNLENNYNNPISPSWEKMGPEPESGGNNVYTGKVNFLKYDPTEQNVVYIGPAEGGLWKSINSGATWTCLTEQNDYNTSGDLAIDASTSPHTLYYGTGELMYECWLYYGNGIYISHDEGSSWTHVGTEGGLPEFTYFYKIAIDPTNNQHLIAAIRSQNMAQTGLYYSFNGGITWNILISNIEFTDCAFAPMGSNAYAVGFKPTTGNGYYISNDHGASFRDAGLNICDLRTRISVCERTQNPDYARYVYILTSHDAGSAVTLYKSADYGSTFSTLNGAGTGDYWSQYCLNIKVCPENPNIVFICKTSLWKSVNGGLNFDNATIFHNDHHCLDFDPYDIQNTVMWGCDGGVVRSTDLGTTYNACNTNLSIKQMYRINSDPYNPEIILGGAQDNGLWRKDNLNSLQWYGYSDGDFSTPKFSKISPNHIIVAPNWGGHEYYSSDAGVSWQYNSRTDLTSNVYGWVTPITSDPINPITFYTTRNGILKTTNDGYNWTQLGQNLPSGSIDAFNISSKNPAYMYAVANQIWDPISFTFYKSINGGGSWNDMQINIPGNNKVPKRPITSIASDPANPDEIVVGLSGFSDASNPGTVFRSQDGCNNWFSITGNLPPNPVNSFIIYYSDCNTKNYVAATDIGVFTSTDGVNWSIMGQPHTLPSAPCVDLDFNRLYQKLFVSLYGRCAYRLDLGGGSSCINPIIVKDNLVIGGDANINYDIIVCSGGTLSFPSACTIQFANGKGITVQDGGNLLATTGNQINFTSQSGQWGGIEFQKGSTGTLKYCQFYNAEIPVAANFLDGGMDNLGGSGITVDRCTFNNGTMTIAGNGSIAVSYNIFNGASSTYNEAIFIHNCDGAGIVDNNILNAPIGIGISSAGVALTRNHVLNSQNNGNTGISIDNCYAFIAKDNEIKGYTTGIFLYNSSPSLFSNNCYNISDTALSTIYNSNPLMHPTDDGSGTLTWVGGQDTLTSSKIGINFNNSLPDINSGYNFINATNAYLYGSAAIVKPYSAYNNCWDWGSPNTNKFQLSVQVRWNPYNCIPPGAYNTLPGNENQPIDIFNGLAGSSTGENEPELDPPNPIIIDLGNGFYDTIKVTTGTINLTGDKLLLSQGVNQQLLGNYSNAISIYQNVVQNYHDSSTSLNALGRILICNDKMHVDTNSYTNLRNYYLTVAQNYPSDTLLRKVAVELANKTLVRKNQFADAITAYENVVQNSNDNLEILCSELNIIETYMIMNSNTNGNSVSFTGKIQSLKPKNFKDGIVMINELLHHIKPSVKENVIPKEFKLSQNYPNPFNPTTKIDYQLPKSEKVVIKVYDILGKLVKELVNENKEPGFYTVTFDGSNFASGVYFYKINAGDFSAVKKMVLIK